MAKIDKTDIPKIGDTVSEIKIEVLDPIASDSDGFYHQRIVYVFKIGKGELRSLCSNYYCENPYPIGSYSVEEFKKL